MGLVKHRATGCFDEQEWQHILTIAMSERPDSEPNTSKALRIIVRQHRLWFETRQLLPYPPRATAAQILATENESLAEPQKAEGMKNLAQEKKRA